MAHDPSQVPCAEVLEDLVALLDGELDRPRADVVLGHLGGCAACEAQRRALAETWESLDAYAAPAADPAWLDAVARRIVVEAGPAPALVVHAGGRRPGAVALRWLAAAAAALLVGSLGWSTLVGPTRPAGDLAVRTDRPAPRAATPGPAGTRLEAAPRPLAPVDDRASTSTPAPAAAGPIAGVEPAAGAEPAPAAAPDPFEALSEDERELAAYLDLLEALAERERSLVLEAQDLFALLEPEELGDEG